MVGHLSGIELSPGLLWTPPGPEAKSAPTAAALGGFSIRDVRVWVSSRNSLTAVNILKSDRPDWAAELRQILGSGSDSADDVIAAAARLLDPLASPKLLAAVDVPLEESFDVASFVLDEANSLYLVSKGTSESMAPFVAALAAEAHYVADRASQTRPGKRLDPPARFVLDEMNNVAPIPDMPSIMTPEVAGSTCGRSRTTNRRTKCAGAQWVDRSSPNPHQA